MSTRDSADRLPTDLESEDERTEELRRSSEYRARASQSVDPVRAADLFDLSALERIAAQAGEERRALPCHALHEAGRVFEAASACDASGGWRRCPWSRSPDLCAREKRAAQGQLAAEHLRAGAVPEPLAERVMVAIGCGSGKPSKLEETDCLKLVRAWLTEQNSGAVLSNGQTVAFTGREWCLALSGPTGCGKSLAGAYAIARSGGLWLRARDVADPRKGIAEFERAKLLVIDDAGTEYTGESGYAVQRLAGIMDGRADDGRRTVVTTNMLRRRPQGSTDTTATFPERYGPRIDSRLDDGRYIVVGGPSLRGTGR